MQKKIYESVLIARLVLKQARLEGLDESRLLEESGCRPSDFEDTFGRLEFGKFEKLFSMAQEGSGNPAFGLRMGEHPQLVDFDLVGFAVAMNETVEHALRMGIHFHEMASNAFRYVLTAQGKESVFRIIDLFPTSPVSRGKIEYYMVSSFLTAPSFMGFRFHPFRIHFSYPEPPHVEEYRRLFDCPLHFEQESNEMFFDGAVLNDPLPAANPELSAQLFAKIEKNSDENSPRPSLANQVREMLFQSPPGGFDLGLAAKRLQVAPRTLQLRLKREGISFSTIRDRACREQAVSLLQGSELSVEEIASKLGYADFTSFYKAFRRWTGSTPRGFSAPA